MAMTDAQILGLIEADGLWVHPSGKGGWNVSPSPASPGPVVWNQPTLRAALELYAERKTQPPEPEVDL